MNRPTHDYIRVKKCGCVTAICLDDEDKFTAEIVAEWIEDGYRVERVSVAEAVERHVDFFTNGCRHERDRQLVLPAIGD